MNTALTILVVEDQVREREALSRLLKAEGYNTIPASNRPEAIGAFKDRVDLVVCDLRLGNDDGMAVLKEWRHTKPSVPVLMVTAYGDIHSAVEAMKLGASDYLTKPLKPDELLVLLNRYLPMRARNEKQNAIDAGGIGRMIGQSKEIREVFDQIRKVSVSDATVLIIGESGTGKELVASAIHDNSRRRKKPFVALNVTALPDSLIESELFGYVRGAFTGAIEPREGRFRVADQGTLFMDEIGDLPQTLQPKLLRVLETYSFAPVGSNTESHVDIRLIAATSRELPEMVKDGQFRIDLYHRLNVLTIELPPLRKRPEDIPVLVNHFLMDCAKRHLRPAPEVAPELLEYFQRYEWPGNVRQLRNVIENMLVMGDEASLTLRNLPKYLSGNPSSEQHHASEGSSNLHDLEKEAILSALKKSLGNRTHAAHTLGVSVRTLQRKLKLWGVE
ncbi:MAG: sigma-54 dependent transcriptional regulator [Planctomycetota bacterium]|nr:sigma-54 dependent transcriptional regulator [Planctomycetota bacterium]